MTGRPLLGDSGRVEWRTLHVNPQHGRTKHSVRCPTLEEAKRRANWLRSIGCNVLSIDRREVTETPWEPVE